LCDFIYSHDHRVEITELISWNRAEALERLGDTFLALHFDGLKRPDLVSLRREDEVIAKRDTPFHAFE
jgi:hypothetical protein